MGEYAANLFTPAWRAFRAAACRLAATPFALLGVWAFRQFAALELAAGRVEA
jgi:hypothetical protein